MLIVATDIFCLNELGRRSNNEDCVSPVKGRATTVDTAFIVCDGVGGENKGEVASEIACTSIQTYLQTHASETASAKDLVLRAIQSANANLAAEAATDASAKRMSTTLALVFFTPQLVLAAWCGDTRIHHIRGNRILWKSRDHSLVGELVSQGELTEEEARQHPRRNVITRSLNALAYNNVVDFYEIKNFETGDYLLLCSDGFLENVTENHMTRILCDASIPDKAAAFLSLCEGVTRDNFSMYLIRGEVKQEIKRRTFSTSMLLLGALLLLLACLAFLMFA